MKKEKNTVSVVIPSRNEEDYIEKCIRSVLASDYGTQNLEIVVADGMSTDQTRTIVKRLQSESPNILLVDNPRQTTPYGLNAGIKASQGEFVMILGAHSEISTDYIRENLRILLDHKDIGGAGGRIVNGYSDEVSEAISIAMSSKFGVGNAKFRTTDYEGYVDTAAFAVYRREVFDRVGFFDENLVRNQDAEFNYRLRQAGYRIYLTNACYAIYYVRSSFKKLFRQYFQYGYWKIHFNYIYKRITSVRQVFPLFYLLNVLVMLFSWLFWMPLFYLTLGFTFLHFVLALYFAMNSSSTFKQKAKILGGFYILHISYGLGYLKGIFQVPFMKK